MAALTGKALVAYLLVCVVWGSTYLAIRIGVTDLPPFLFAGVRFLIAGGLLLAVTLILGHRLPRRAREWRTQIIVGLLLLAGGNSFVVWAEQFVTSGAASIFVVTVALWMAFFDAIIPGGQSAINWRVVLGLAAGFVGTGLLVGATPAEIARADLRGPLALTAASASWALGSIYFKRHPGESNPYVASSIQMIAGGASVAIAGLLLGEGAAWRFTPAGIGALAYLVVFGSIVGYSAYAYALRHAPATIVGTYAYVNPIVAVLLGWLILDEVVTVRTFAAMALILGAVVWIQLSHRVRAQQRSRATTDYIAGGRLDTGGVLGAPASVDVVSDRESARKASLPST
jgi:drug/metabolite transporter (DMT)-like permease